MFSGSSGDTSTIAKYLMIAVCVMLFFPMIINIYAGVNEQIEEVDETQQTLLEDYRGIVNASATQEQAWVLTGIYSPYGVNASGSASTSYMILQDGWIVGDRVTNYTPSQYVGALDNHETYSVAYDSSRGMYYYTTASSGGYQAGDLYTRVTMDRSQMSSIFFSEAGKVEQGSNFYYTYNGWKYTFQPTANYEGVDSNGKAVDVVANTTSLSLIWYYYLTTSGIAGQLVLSGSDSGVSYLTANEIVRAFNSSNYTSKFTMEFNGVDMNVYILLNPYAISSGYTVEECYNNGYWSMLVTSLSTEPDAYNNTDYSFNIYEIWDTIIALFTFDAEDLFSGDETTSYLASIIFCGTFYILLIAIGLNHKEVLILAGIVALVQGAIEFLDPVTEFFGDLADNFQDFVDKISAWFTGWAIDGDWDWWPFW